MKISDRDFQKLLKNELLASANKSTLAYVLDACGTECLNFCDEELLHSPEKQGGQIGILLAGSATVTTPGESHNTLLRFLHEGDMFGIANLFSDTPYVSVIRASGNGRICWIPEAAIRMLLEEDRAFLYQYLGFLSGRIRYLNRKIGFLSAGSAERKLALYLASLGKETVRLDASISALSELLDVGRASLYRAFDKLTEDGFIRKEGRNFTLLDAEGMLNAYR